MLKLKDLLGSIVVGKYDLWEFDNDDRKICNCVTDDELKEIAVINEYEDWEVSMIYPTEHHLWNGTQFITTGVISITIRR